MKKFISVILTVVILISSLLGINVFAEESRSETFVKKLNETRSIGVTVVKLAAKTFTCKNGKNEFKIAGREPCSA